MACAGDSTSTCGGFYYINILSLTTTTTVTTATSSYTSLGCYTDSGSPRLLTGASTSSSSMTAAVCSSFCSASGYTYFGTEYSTQVSRSRGLGPDRMGADTPVLLWQLARLEQSHILEHLQLCLRRGQLVKVRRILRHQRLPGGELVVPGLPRLLL